MKCPTHLSQKAAACWAEQSSQAGSADLEKNDHIITGDFIKNEFVF